jgi:DNA-binding LacI/PurR family transcriptional regulator
LLSGPESSVSARARLAGWQATLAQAGLDAVAVEYGDWSAASGYEKGHMLLSGTVLPEAILVANDQMALGVMRACAEKGVAIPGQLSVVGFDDTADSAWFSPPLTTVRQAFRQAGERSVTWLLDPPGRCVLAGSAAGYAGDPSLHRAPPSAAGRTRGSGGAAQTPGSPGRAACA